MARRRYKNNFNQGPYKFTARRRQALRKAQLRSARSRKGTGLGNVAKTAGVLGGAVAAGYLGHRYGSAAIAKSVRNKKIEAYGKNAGLRDNSPVFDPRHLEAARAANAISAGHPSRTTTAITAQDRAKAVTGREELARPRPDNRIYNEDDSINTEAMTNRSVAQTKRHARNKRRRELAALKRETQGKTTSSHSGTPGPGATTPKNARASRAASSSTGMTDAQLKSALGFEENTRHVPHDTGTKTSSAVTPTPGSNPRASRAASQGAKPAVPTIGQAAKDAKPAEVSPERSRQIMREDTKPTIKIVAGKKLVSNWNLMSDIARARLRRQLKDQGKTLSPHGEIGG